MDQPRAPINTAGSKIILALAIILVIFSHLIDNFYHLMLGLSSVKPKNDDLTNIYFDKTALGMCFLT